MLYAFRLPLKRIFQAGGGPVIKDAGVAIDAKGLRAITDKVT